MTGERFGLMRCICGDCCAGVVRPGGLPLPASPWSWSAGPAGGPCMYEHEVRCKVILQMERPFMHVSMSDQFFSSQIEGLEVKRFGGMRPHQ